MREIVGHKAIIKQIEDLNEAMERKASGDQVEKKGPDSGERRPWQAVRGDQRAETNVRMPPDIRRCLGIT